jgi:uncharacterized membrane protein YgdD (TMEM256/DUF423 family)
MRANWITLGAWLAGLAVIAGAFGAHALRDQLAPEALDVWKTGVLYHLLHALALVLYGLFARTNQRSPCPGILFLAGIVLFSGSLYGLALGAPHWIGAITPFGGGAWIAGWIAFGWQAREKSRG